MLSYYLERGITPEHILSLPSTDRDFYKASMLLAIEQKKKIIEAASGR